MTKRRNGNGGRGYDVAKAIDTIEKAALTAMKIYRAVEPIVRAVLTDRSKTK